MAKQTGRKRKAAQKTPQVGLEHVEAALALVELYLEDVRYAVAEIRWRGEAGAQPVQAKGAAASAEQQPPGQPCGEMPLLPKPGAACILPAPGRLCFMPAPGRPCGLFVPPGRPCGWVTGHAKPGNVCQPPPPGMPCNVGVGIPSPGQVCGGVLIPGGPGPVVKPTQKRRKRAVKKEK